MDELLAIYIYIELRGLVVGHVGCCSEAWSARDGHGLSWRRWDFSTFRYYSLQSFGYLRLGSTSSINSSNSHYQIEIQSRVKQEYKKAFENLNSSSSSPYPLLPSSAIYSVYGLARLARNWGSTWSSQLQMRLWRT